MSKRILIIEPHADDALFSLYSIISNQSDKIAILTCCTHENYRSSKQLIDTLPQVKMVIELKHSESEYLWSSRNFTHHDINKLSSEVNSFDWMINKTIESHDFYDSDKELLKNDISKTVEELEKFYFGVFDEVLIPIGVVHPWHVLVNQACVSTPIITNYSFYAERPYTHKKFTHRIISDFYSKLEGTQYHQIEFDYDGDSKRRDINRIYPGELSNFHWDLDKILELPEMIITERTKEWWINE